MRAVMLLVAIGSVLTLAACQNRGDSIPEPVSAAVPASKPKIRRFNPTGLMTPIEWSHVVEVTGGRTIYLAGQTPANKEGKVANDVREQVVQVFENLKTALTAAGVGFEGVVDATYYMVDLADVPVMHEIRGRYIKGDFPASSLVEVKRLARDDFKLEISAIAVAPE